MPIGDNADKLVMKVTLNTTDSIFPSMLYRDFKKTKSIVTALRVVLRSVSDPPVIKQSQNTRH